MPTKDDYMSFIFGRDKNFSMTITVSAIVCLAILLLLEFVYPNLDSFSNFIKLQNLCYVQIVPVILLTSLSGYGTGTFIVLAYFLIVSFFGKFGIPYHAFVLLIASLISNFPVLMKWYKSVWKSILTILIFSIVLGNGWQFLSAVLERRDISFDSELVNFFLAFISCFVSVALCYIFFNFFPESAQKLFYTSTYSSERLSRIKDVLTKKKGLKISVKMTRLIVFSALILIIASYVFVKILLSEFHIFDDAGAIIFATRFMILMFIVAVPIILFDFHKTNANVSSPIALIAKAIEDSNFGNITEHTEDIPRLDIKSLDIKLKDEIGILYDFLVDTFSAAENYIKNLERAHQLETQLAAAKAASKAKSDFLSNMSHEIRTPINAVLGLNEMIIRESSEKEIINYARDVENAGKGLLGIVNDILDFSKIEAGKLEIIPTNYDLSASINDLVNMISKRAHDKNLKFIVNVDPKIPHLLYGDDVRIKQCCLNILTNAIKYTNNGSVTLNISSEKIDDSHIMLTVHVVDTGIGIKDKDIPKLFTAFQRIEEERNRTIEGTGLGLNIVQSLLNLMNSRLEVVSLYGKGSDFYFSLLQGVIDWEEIGDFKEAYRKKIENTISYHELFTAPNARILVVDDTELNLTVVKGLLKQTKIQVDTVMNGFDALAAVQKTHYDLIFLDHRMPKMDGVQTFKKMLTLKTNRSKGVPVIALTANAVAGAKEMYITAGFTDYMTKPIEGKKLEGLIMKYLPDDLIENVEIKMEDGIMTLDENGVIESNKAEAIKKKFGVLKGINVKNALKYTGGPEVLEQAIKEFYKNIDKKSSEIEGFAAQKDWRNYTILVHALKSSARLIGAEKLSEEAKYLEKCGDEGNEPEILEKTPSLIESYRSYKENLDPLCAEGENDSGKAEMPLSQYDEAVSNIGECVQAFDYDTADQIIAMMSDYKIPDAKKEHFQKLKEAVSAVDQEKILKIVKE